MGYMVIIGADELKADIKAVLFSRQFHFVIIGEGQIFKRHHQNCLLFEKIIPHDNGGSSNVQNMGYFCKSFSSW